MIARSLKGKILVFTVFFIGIATGMLILNFYETRVSGSRLDPVDTTERVSRAQREVTKFHDYLGLSKEQREQTRKLFEEMRGDIRKLRAETQPKFQAIQEQSRAKIRAILNEDQRRKYDEFRQEREERRNRDRRDGDSDRNRQ
jgi:hypothetical protein